MALIFRGETQCPLCREVIAADDDIVATSHFIGDPKDSLWQYSDAAFHRQCFAAWARREEFVKRFNETMKPFVFGNGKRQLMQDDGSIVQIKPED
jgi:hypothetical protein